MQKQEMLNERFHRFELKRFRVKGISNFGP